MIFRKIKLSLLYKGKEWGSNYEERHDKHGLNSCYTGRKEIFMNQEIKCNRGSYGDCELLSRFGGGPWGKTLGIFTIFSLKLVC